MLADGRTVGQVVACQGRKKTEIIKKKKKKRGKEGERSRRGAEEVKESREKMGRLLKRRGYF